MGLTTEVFAGNYILTDELITKYMDSLVRNHVIPLQTAQRLSNNVLFSHFSWVNEELTDEHPIRVIREIVSAIINDIHNQHMFSDKTIGAEFDLMMKVMVYDTLEVAEDITRTDLKITPDEHSTIREFLKDCNIISIYEE